MTSPTLDCLNQHRAPRLEDLILAEVFLAGGPCYIHQLWSEMYERKRSISVGTLLFTEAVMRLEQDGLLREINGNRTAITNQGQVHLFGLVLLGMIPDEQKRRLESKGVLGVASAKPQAKASPITTGDVTGFVGSNGGGASNFLSSPPFPSDERFADNITRALDAYEMAEQLRAEEETAAEEGALIEASNMPYPEYERNGR